MYSENEGSSYLRGAMGPLASVECSSVRESFCCVVEEFPSALAVVCGAEEISYSELAAAVDRVADALRRWPVADSRILAVEGVPSVELIATMLAVLTTDRALALVDPDLPTVRRREIEWLLGIEEDAALLPGITTGGVQVVSGSVSVSKRVDRDTSHLFFSSGTTGAPKPVLGSRTLLHEFLDWERRALGIRPGDRVAMTTALSFDVVLRDVLLPLTGGATLVIPERPIAPDDMLAWLGRFEVSVLHAVPTLARQWLAAAPPGFTDLPALRATLFAGEQLLPALVGSWRRTAPGSQVWNLYGPTETVLAKAAYRVPEPLPNMSVMPIGRAIPGAQVLVLDPTHRPSPAGVPGEIAVRFSARSFGYLGEPGANRERFVPLAEGGTIYLTGDRGRADADGPVEFLGRMDNVIKVRGVRVDLDEVAALLSEYDGVATACVVAVGTDADRLLVGHVGMEAGVDAESLPRRVVDFLRTRLPAPMVPNSVVVHDRMPVTANGKVDRVALREHALPSAGFASPETPEEERLSRIWAEVLALGRVGRTDDFFDLGGHSLTAARMLSLVKKELGADIPLTTLFQCSQLREFARAVVSATGSEARKPLSRPAEDC